MESIHSHQLTVVMVLVTDLGTWGTALVSLIAAAVFAVKKNLRLSALWIGAWIGAIALDQVLKLLIARPRPPLPHLVHVMNFSFPSGHALISMVVYGLGAYSLSVWSYTRAYKPFFIVLWIILFTSIGFSRMYLEVHYFSDVIAGYAIGAAWLIGCIKWARKNTEIPA
jgi:undecaprenyl-diphosphatase